jgi:hypothetical protein
MPRGDWVIDRHIIRRLSLSLHAFFLPDFPLQLPMEAISFLISWCVTQTGVINFLLLGDQQLNSRRRTGAGSEWLRRRRGGAGRKLTVSTRTK